MNDAQKTLYLTNLTGIRGVKAMSKLINVEASEFDAMTKKVNESGVAQNSANKLMDTAAGTLKKLQSALQEVQIVIGTALLPVIMELTGWVQGLINWFNGLSEGTKAFIAKALALTTAVAGGILVLTGLIKATMLVVTAIKAVGIAITWLTAHPLVAIITAVAALVVAILYLTGVFDGLFGSSKKVGGGVDDMTKKLDGLTAQANEAKAAASDLSDTDMTPNLSELNAKKNGVKMSDISSDKGFAKTTKQKNSTTKDNTKGLTDNTKALNSLTKKLDTIKSAAGTAGGNYMEALSQ